MNIITSIIFILTPVYAIFAPVNFLKKILVLLCVIGLFSGTVSADPIPETPCREDPHTQTALFKVPQGTYKIYAATDNGSDTARVYLNQFDDLDVNHCQLLGPTVAVNQQKLAVGDVTITASSAISWYIKTQNAVSQNLSANRLRIFLVPTNVQLCIDSQCRVDDSHTQLIIPVQSNTATNRVVIAYYVNPAEDTLKTVDYFADDNFLFAKQTLTEFPTEYQSIINYSKLSTLSKYESGQAIVRTQQLKDDQYGSATPTELLRKYINPYEDKLPTAGIFLGITTFAYAILLLYRKWYVKRQWKYNHGLLTRKVEHYDPEKSLKRIELVTTLLNIRRIAVVFIGLFALLIILNTFVIDTFDISGHSMEKTLHNGEKVLILKLPVSYKKFIHGNYIPTRGSIIVAKINESEGSYVSTFGNGKKAMIKRVVAIPGDRVVVKDKRIYVYIQNKGEAKLFGEGQPWAKTVQNTTDHFDIDRVLGINEVFVAGDNRAASIDSRINGPINAGQIIGVMIYKF